MARSLLTRALCGARIESCALALAAAACIAATGACDAGDPRVCTVTCGAGGECPQGTSCGSDLYCHGPGESPGSCAEGGGNGDDDGNDGSDGDGSDGGSDGGDGDPACDPCDPVEQCGCAEGDACYVGGEMPEPTCAPAGAAGEEGACVTDADCAAGLACHIEFGLGGHCQAYCAEDGDCGGGARLCNREVTGSEVRTCTSDCDPFDSTTCAADEKCTLSEGADGRWDARCLQHGGLAQYYKCYEQYDCAPGLICGDSDVDYGLCVPFCVVGELCPLGTELCTGYFPPIALGSIEYGYCP